MPLDVAQLRVLEVDGPEEPRLGGAYLCALLGVRQAEQAEQADPARAQLDDQDGRAEYRGEYRLYLSTLDRVTPETWPGVRAPWTGRLATIEAADTSWCALGTIQELYDARGAYRGDTRHMVYLLDLVSGRLAPWTDHAAPGVPRPEGPTSAVPGVLWEVLTAAQPDLLSRIRLQALARGLPGCSAERVRALVATLPDAVFGDTTLAQRLAQGTRTERVQAIRVLPALVAERAGRAGRAERAARATPAPDQALLVPTRCAPNARSAGGGRRGPLG